MLIGFLHKLILLHKFAVLQAKLFSIEIETMAVFVSQSESKKIPFPFSNKNGY